jgi:hypothetical protein
MTETLCIKPLRCGHCGQELPVMGQLVTFQCPECARYWVLSNDSIEPISVFRAAPSGASAPEGEGACVHLPFWVVDVDGAGLKNQIEEAVKEIHGAAQAVIRTGYAMDEVKKSPAASEIAHLAARIESLGIFKVYVPAFKSLNTYAYLKGDASSREHSPRSRSSAPTAQGTRSCAPCGRKRRSRSSTSSSSPRSPNRFRATATFSRRYSSRRLGRRASSSSRSGSGAPPS